MSKELREKVARALWETNGISAFIDAAIDVVLEEAARVAIKDKDTYPTCDWDDAWNAACEHIAAAIRAMKQD